MVASRKVTPNINISGTQGCFNGSTFTSTCVVYPGQTAVSALLSCGGCGTNDLIYLYYPNAYTGIPNTGYAFLPNNPFANYSGASLNLVTYTNTPPGNYQTRPAGQDQSTNQPITASYVMSLCVASPTLKINRTLPNGTIVNVTNNTTPIVVSVGEQINIAATFGSGCVGTAPVVQGTWSVPGYLTTPPFAIRDYQRTNTSGTVYPLSTTDLSSPGLSFYWVSPGTNPTTQGYQTVSYTVSPGGGAPNVTALVKFDIRRPTVNLATDNGGEIVCGLISQGSTAAMNRYGQAYGFTPASTKVGIAFNGSGLTAD